MISDKMLLLISSFGAFNYLVMFFYGSDLVSAIPEPVVVRAFYMVFAFAGLLLLAKGFLSNGNEERY